MLYNCLFPKPFPLYQQRLCNQSQELPIFPASGTSTLNLPILDTSQSVKRPIKVEPYNIFASGLFESQI